MTVASGTSPTAVVVDAYSSGMRLPGLFHARGWRCLHVQSGPEVPPPYRASFPGAEAFEGHWVFDGDLDALAEDLRAYAPDCVVAGAETGVLLQDRLARALGCPGNPVDSSQVRRDKHAMQERLRERGVAHIPQCKSEGAEQLIAFADAEAGWPLLVKPLQSCGGDGVVFCDTPDQVRAAVGRLVGARNVLGLSNGPVLGQRCLRGAEHVVNAVFRDGEAFISEIWRIHKQTTSEGRTIYDHGELLEASGPDQDSLRAYFLEMARALDFREGAAHAEVMLTDDGPVLIEVGARLAGSVSHETTDGALGYSHPSLLVESICEPERFGSRLGGYYQRRQHARFVSLISRSEGLLRDTPGYARIAELPSFVEALNPRAPGQRVERTVDLFSSPGLVYLRHPDRHQIDADRNAIREIERDGFFVTEAA